jgi:hypothetical protein
MRKTESVRSKKRRWRAQDLQNQHAREEADAIRDGAEKQGTAVVINLETVPQGAFKQLDGQIIITTIQTQPLPTIIHNAYAPQAHAQAAYKPQFWKDVDGEIEEGSTPAFRMAMGASTPDYQRQKLVKNT